jgi:hypothetical protein
MGTRDARKVLEALAGGAPEDRGRKRMTRGQFRMVRVPVPEWAPPHARGAVRFEMVATKYGDAITPAERDELMKRHTDILAVADALVEEYANSGCAPPGEDWFPEQVKLTGEFYVGSESYHRLPGERWIQVCVEARCLGHEPDSPGDYLGLDVWLRYDPENGRLWNHRNTDSMAI